MLDARVGSDNKTQEGTWSREVTSVYVSPLHHLDFLFCLPERKRKSHEAVKDAAAAAAVARPLVYHQRIKKKMKGTRLLKIISSEGRLEVSMQQAINPVLKNTCSGFLHECVSVHWVPLDEFIPGTAGSAAAGFLRGRKNKQNL